MSAHAEFSKHAHYYGEYNVIQTKVAQKLLDDLKVKPKNIIDLGCGNGTLYKKIDFELDSFLAVDFSAEMLELHPKNSNVETMLGDFNDENLFHPLGQRVSDHLFSASALQWSDDLTSVLKSIQNLNIDFSLAIFTSGTFKTLHETANTNALLKSAHEIKEIASALGIENLEIQNYALEFDSTREMFRYIKKSGVSAGRNVLSFKETKRLMNEYPFKHLEFEVLFLRS